MPPPSSTLRLAQVALVTACIKPMMELLLNPRSQTILGAQAVFQPRIRLLSQTFTAVIIVSSLAVIGTAGLRLRGLQAQLVVGVWLLAGARTVAGLAAAEQPGFPKESVLFALVLHAVVAGFGSRAELLRWALPLLRIVTTVSVASMFISPRWAFIGSGVDGSERLLFGVPRLTGLAPHAGPLSDLSVVALLLEWRTRSSSPLFRTIGIISACVCVLLTQTRTLWLALAIAVLVVLAVRHSAARVALVTGLAALATTLLVQPAIIMSHVLSATNGDLVTVSGRTYIWRVAWNEFLRSPLSGYGPNFLNAYYRQTYLPATEQQSIHAHNQFYQTLGESGLFGLVALLFVCAVLARTAWRHRESDRWLGVSLLIVLTVDAITGVPFRPVGLVTVMPLVLLAYVALSNSKDEGRGPRPVGSLAGSAETRATARAPRGATGLRQTAVWPAGKGSMPS